MTEPTSAATIPPARPPAQTGSQVDSSAQGRSDLSHHKVLSSISRVAMLELMRSRAKPLGVVEVAQHMGLHQNTVRSHLDLLVDSGYAIRRSEVPSGPGRPRVVYEATATPAGERDYRLLAEVLAQHIASTSERPGEAAVNAGRSWATSTGRRSHGDGQPEPADAGSASGMPISEAAAVDVVVRMLGDTGFAPELSADGTSLHLHRCPFRELAVTHQDVVCGAHLGVIQGALEDLGGMVSASRLIPFVTPGLCVANLTRSTTVPGA